MRFWTFLILLFIQQSLSAQIKPEEKLILGDSIAFIGIDFSTAKFFNPEKLSKANYIRDKHGPTWGQIDDRIVEHADMKFDLQKKFVMVNTSMFDSSFKLQDSTWVTWEDYKGLGDDQIRTHVKKYAFVPSGNLLLVLLIDKMDIVKKAVSVCAVYMDGGKNVIKVIHAVGNVGGSYGYSSWFNTAIENAYKDFIVNDDKYLKSLKKAFK